MPGLLVNGRRSSSLLAQRARSSAAHLVIDNDAWRLAAIGATGLMSDGVPGPAMVKALVATGRAHGIWALE